MGARYQILASGGVFDHQTRAIVLPDKSSAGWKEYQASLTAGEVPLPPDSAGQLSLVQAQAQRCEEINAYAAAMRNKVISGRSAGELASWVLKLLDAMSVQAGVPSPFAPLLPLIGSMLGMPRAPTSINDALAHVRGISEAEHAGKVVTQALPALLAETLIDGVRGAHCDAVLELTDVRDIVAYPWLTGWPKIPGV